MKPVLIVVGCLVAVVALVAVIGALLPKDHVAARRVRLRAAPGEVWKALTDIDAFPTWRADVERVERLPSADGRTAWREVGKHGAIAFEMVEATPPTRLVGRIADPTLPFGGTWTYAIAPAEGGGSVVTITENGEVRNVIFRFMSRFVFGHSATLEAYLRALGKKFGEDVPPEPAA